MKKLYIFGVVAITCLLSACCYQHSDNKIEAGKEQLMQNLKSGYYYGSRLGNSKNYKIPNKLIELRVKVTKVTGKVLVQRDTLISDFKVHCVSLGNPKNKFILKAVNGQLTRFFFKDLELTFRFDIEGKLIDIKEIPIDLSKGPLGMGPYFLNEDGKLTENINLK